MSSDPTQAARGDAETRRGTAYGERIKLEPAHWYYLARLKAAAAEDNHHRLIYPTDVVIDRQNQVVGYCSAGNLPMFFAWMHSQAPARDTFEAWHLAQDLMKGRQHCLAIQGHSPLLPFVERMGYERLGEAILYLRRANQDGGEHQFAATGKE